MMLLMTIRTDKTLAGLTHHFHGVCSVPDDYGEHHSIVWAAHLRCEGDLGRGNISQLHRRHYARMRQELVKRAAETKEDDWLRW